MIKCSSEFLGEVYANAYIPPRNYAHYALGSVHKAVQTKWVENMLERYRTMKNSLFKRVAAAAAAVPLALTQCLTFSSVAAENDAVQIVGNTVQDSIKPTVSMDTLLYSPADKTVSTWNITAATALTEMVGTSGTINKDKVLELVKYVPKALKEATTAALEEYVLINPVTYEVNGDKDVVIKATVSQPNFNGNWANTPGKALTELANEYNAPALKKVDFSSVNCAGDLTITIKTSELDNGTTVPVEVAFKTSDKTVYLGDFAKFASEKLTEIETIAKAAIADSVAADKVDEATEKFLAKTALVREKLTEADNASNNILTKNAEYESVSEALTAANDFLARKNINRRVPTSATEIAALETVKGYYDAAVKKASNKADIQITAEQLGQFIDGLTSKSITDSNNNVTKTDFDITVGNGKAVLVGAFDDAEANAVQKWVETQGYAYVGSYKKLTGTIDFSGVKTADTASVDVQIERILVTETTTTTETTTSDTTSSDTTTSETTTSSDTTTSSETTSSETTTTETGSTTDTDTTTSETTTSSETTSSETTTTDTTSTTDSETTTTTTTTIPPTVTITSVVANEYAEIETVAGFYFNTETSFDKAQIQKVIYHTVINEGYTDDNGNTVVTREYEKVEGGTDITADVDFGTKTPANTYEKVENVFLYRVPVNYNGKVLKDKDGNDLTVSAYIGVKGDTDLNNIVDGRDATATLTYYAKTSTDGNDASNTALSTSTLVAGNALSVYDDFAAFLSDVQIDAGSNLTRFAKKSERLIDGRDATAILTFYAKSSTEQYKDMADNEPGKLWDIVTGVTTE